jgi:hypothetical protein
LVSLLQRGHFSLLSAYVTIFILVYVDNIIIASSSQTFTMALLKNLEEFALKNLSDLHFFLGIEVSKINEGILQSQRNMLWIWLKGPA